MGKAASDSPPASEDRVALASCGDPRARVRLQLDEIERASGLDTRALAAAFATRVSARTIAGWRSSCGSGLPDEQELYRLELLHELMRACAAAQIEPRSWLHRPARGGETPFELICAGRLGEVRSAVELVVQGLASPDEPAVIVEPLREHDAHVDWDETGNA